MEGFWVKKRLNREKLKAFIVRRKANYLGLLTITLVSLIATLVLALRHSRRTGILVVVTVLLLVLCALQTFKMRSSYRTMHSFHGLRKKKNRDAQA